MIKENDPKSNILAALFWKLMERGGTQGIQFIVQIVLARLLAPEQFGIVAIVMVFINLAHVFVQSGFNTALIQKKDADEEDFSSIFYLSLGIAGILYILIYLAAPLIGGFYSDNILVPVLRVLSVTLFFGAFNSVQIAFISRNLLFKKLFMSSLGAVLFSGLLGIIFAYSGLGVWALVIQQLVYQFTITFIMWFTVKWRPKLVFSISKVKVLFSFGWKLLFSALLNVLYMDLRTLIIGRLYSPSILGFYNRGEQFPKVIISNIDGSIQSVMLPAMAAQQDDKKRVKEMMRRGILSSSFVVFPLMIGMAVVAEPLVKLVLTDKWLPAVPFLQIASITFAMYPIHTANLQAINAMGRSDFFLKLEIVKKIIGVIVLVISIPFGIYAIALGGVFTGLIATFINSYPNKGLLNYSFKEQWADIMPSLIISTIMGLAVYLVSFLRISALSMLIIQVILGVAIYLLLSIIFKNESYKYLINTIKRLFLNRKEISG